MPQQNIDIDIFWWIGFNAFVVLLLALDLGVFHRKAHEVKPKEAAIWSVVWVALSLIFNLFIYLQFGQKAGTEFLTGYLIEKSLSVDNLFVFVLIFTYFKVPARYQHRILFWGILGALVMRATLIGVGSYLITNFEWVIYIFGGFLIFTGVRMALDQGHDVEVEHNPLLRLLRRKFPVTDTYHDQKFFVRQFGKVFITPMMVVLVLIESTDLLFALDSIPAIFAVTNDAFIVYTSNIFAILGLRALYFLLASVITKFAYLKYGLAIILVYIGVKMLLTFFHIEIDTVISLGVIAAVLSISAIASFLFPPKTQPEGPATIEEKSAEELESPLDHTRSEGNTAHLDGEGKGPIQILPETQKPEIAPSGSAE